MNESSKKSSSVSHPETEQRRIRLRKLTHSMVKEIDVNNAFIRKAWQRVTQLVSPGPRTEIHHDWLTILSFAKRAAEGMISKQDVDDEKLRTLATLQAYLQLAKHERDFAQAWTYVNLADTLLPLVVDEDELDACSVRLRTCSKDLSNNLKKIEENKASSPQTPKPPGSKATSEVLEGDSEIAERRYVMHGEQIARALRWNVSNRRISLKLTLWRSLEGWLLLGLVAIAIVAEIMHAQQYPPQESPVSLPFAVTALLGFFGGGLSALRKARSEVIRIPSHELIRVHTILRMLLGAAGSLIIYIVIQWIPIGNIPSQLNSNIYVFLSIGIAAGFSEKLFVSALEKIAENLEASGMKMKDNSGGAN